MAMTLVDAGYGSDDDDDDAVAVDRDEKEEDNHSVRYTTRPSVNDERSSARAPPSASIPLSTFAPAALDARIPPGSGGSVTEQRSQITLPDPSDLLGLNVTEASNLATATRKRHPVVGSAPPLHPNKLPRNNLQQSRVLPNISRGLLVPPQLRGRSNVATEDLDKIFSRRRR